MKIHGMQVTKTYEYKYKLVTTLAIRKTRRFAILYSERFHQYLIEEISQKNKPLRIQPDALYSSLHRSVEHAERYIQEYLKERYTW